MTDGRIGRAAPGDIRGIDPRESGKEGKQERIALGQGAGGRDVGGHHRCGLDLGDRSAAVNLQELREHEQALLSLRLALVGLDGEQSGRLRPLDHLHHPSGARAPAPARVGDQVGGCGPPADG